jgi:Thiol:disulfide interchange protein DsbD, N-terminal
MSGMRHGISSTHRTCTVLASCILAALLLAAPAFGAPSQPIVTGQLVLATNSARAGSTVKVALVAQIAPGYHINDHVPTLDYLIPTELKLDGAPPLSAGPATYPKGEARKFAFLDKPISVYENKLVVDTQVEVAAGAKPGEYTLKGALRYQACNDRACFPPTSLPLTLTVRVVARTVGLKDANSDAFRGIKPK